MSGRFGAIKRALDPSNIPDLPGLGRVQKSTEKGYGTALRIGGQLGGHLLPSVARPPRRQPPPVSSAPSAPAPSGGGYGSQPISLSQFSLQTPTPPSSGGRGEFTLPSSLQGATQPGTMDGTTLPGRTQSGTTGGGTIPDPWVTGNTGNNGVYYGPGVRKPDTSDPWAIFNPTTNPPSRTSSRPSSPTRTGTYNPTGGYMTGYRKGASGGRTPTGGGDVGFGQRLGEFVGRNRIPLAGVGLTTGTAAGVTGLANTGLFDQSDQANPRPTTPTPAEDAGSVSPTAPTAQGGAMTNRGSQSLGQVRPGYTPPTHSGIQVGFSSNTGFAEQAIGALNNFLGKGYTTALGSRVKVSGGEEKHMESEGYQQGTRNMYMNDSFRWGGVDREWAKVSRSQMEQAGVSQADLARYSMQSEPQGNYVYRGSNQAQIEQATGMKNAAYGNGDSVYIPVAKGKGDMLNQYLTSRMGKK